jgi:hypothetical protein
MLAAFTGVYSWHETAQTHAEARDNATAARANAVAAFLPYVRGDADSTQIRIVSTALTSLGYEEMALRLAQLRPSASSVQALETLATAGGSRVTRDSAVATLAHISDATLPAADSGRARLASLADSALARVQATEPPPAGDSSAIVTGGYGNARQARIGSDSSVVSRYPSAVYFRNGVYRTAIRYRTRREAREALPQVRANVRRSAYIVDWSQWCPAPKQQTGYVRCGPSLPEAPKN